MCDACTRSFEREKGSDSLRRGGASAPVSSRRSAASTASTAVRASEKSKFEKDLPHSLRKRLENRKNRRR